ncbi:MAG: twin-arginine translocation signal domain-containing protein, partial [Rhodoblastus sp.]
MSAEAKFQSAPAQDGPFAQTRRDALKTSAIAAAAGVAGLG